MALSLMSNSLGAVGSLFNWQRQMQQQGMGQQMPQQQQQPAGTQGGVPQSQAVQQQFANQQAQFAGGLSQAAVNTGQAKPQVQGPASTETPVPGTNPQTQRRRKNRRPGVGGSSGALSQVAAV